MQNTGMRQRMKHHCRRWRQRDCVRNTFQRYLSGVWGLLLPCDTHFILKCSVQKKIWSKWEDYWEQVKGAPQVSDQLLSSKTTPYHPRWPWITPDHFGSLWTTLYHIRSSVSLQITLYHTESPRTTPNDPHHPRPSQITPDHPVIPHSTLDAEMITDWLNFSTLAKSNHFPSVQSLYPPFLC